MEDERLIFMRKLLALCKEYKVDLVADEDSISVFRDIVCENQPEWIEDLAFRFIGERGVGVVDVALGGCWGGEHHEVTT